MLRDLSAAALRGVKVTIVARPETDFTGRNAISVQKANDILRSKEITLIAQSGIHQKFAVIDQMTVWYGSINLLSFGDSEESIMRLESPGIGGELLKTIKGT